jgi:tetratricopeptide (TPR) repeat protein
MPYTDPSHAWIFIAGVSAAKLGDVAGAEAAAARLRTARETMAAGDAYAAKGVAILEKEVAALARLAAGRKEEAVQLAKDAVDIEVTTDAPSGPPEPMKPALELYGDVLLEAGRPADAATAYAQSLLRTPKRTPSLLGLARASAKAGNLAAAREHYMELARMPGASPASPAVQEAQKFLEAGSDRGQTGVGVRVRLDSSFEDERQLASTSAVDSGSSAPEMPVRSAFRMDASSVSVKDVPHIARCAACRSVGVAPRAR